MDSLFTLQDIREGQGPTPSEGSNCSVDWDGYTIGYYVGHLMSYLRPIFTQLVQSKFCNWGSEQDPIESSAARSMAESDKCVFTLICLPWYALPIM